MMSTMAEQRRWPREETVPPPSIRRTVELWLTGVGAVLATLFLGGFALVVNRLDEVAFAEVVQPVLLSGADQLSPAEAFEAGRTLSAWFGLTLLLVLVLAAVAVLLTRSRPWRRTPGWWLLAAGAVCLWGSQLIAYPIAFFFFLGAGLFAARPVRDRSSS